MASPLDANPDAPVEVVDAPALQANQAASEEERDVAKPKTAATKPSASKNAPPTSDAKANTPNALPPDCENPGIQTEIKLEELERVRGDGALAHQAVDQEFTKRRSAFRACYERELRRNPSLQGTVRGEFTIDPSGRVSNALTAGGSANHANLDSCVRKVVATLRSANPPQGGDVSYRFAMSFTTDGDPFRCHRECGFMR